MSSFLKTSFSKKKMLQDLSETSNKLFRNLKNKGGNHRKKIEIF